MMLEDDEEILWETYASIAEGKESQDFIEGKFIMTNKKMLLQKKKKALLGLVDMGEDIIWKVNIEEVTDLITRKRKVIEKKRCLIEYNNNEYVVLRVRKMTADNIKDKLEKIIQGSKKGIKDKDFERELELRKASRSEVNVNVGNPERKRPNRNRKGKIPGECFACGEEIDRDDIEWIAPGKFECPECNASIKVK